MCYEGQSDGGRRLLQMRVTTRDECRRTECERCRTCVCVSVQVSAERKREKKKHRMRPRLQKGSLTTGLRYTKEVRMTRKRDATAGGTELGCVTKLKKILMNLKKNTMQCFPSIKELNLHSLRAQYCGKKSLPRPHGKIYTRIN